MLQGVHSIVSPSTAFLCRKKSTSAEILSVRWQNGNNAVAARSALYSLNVWRHCHACRFHTEVPFAVAWFRNDIWTMDDMLVLLHVDPVYYLKWQIRRNFSFVAKQFSPDILQTGAVCCSASLRQSFRLLSQHNEPLSVPHFARESLSEVHTIMSLVEIAVGFKRQRASRDYVPLLTLWYAGSRRRDVWYLATPWI